jgi:hypothetical protein
VAIIQHSAVSQTNFPAPAQNLRGGMPMAEC